MNVILKFSYSSDSLQGKDYAEFINDFLYFIPKVVLFNNRAINKKDKLGLIEEVKGLPNNSKILLSAKKDFLQLNEIKRDVSFPFESIVIDISYGDFQKCQAKIDNWIRKSGFRSLFITNSDYYFAQNRESLEDMYKADLKKYVGNYVIKTGLLGEEVVDISKNPGRQGYLKESILLAGWKMWFSKDFQEDYPKITHLLDAPFVSKAERLFDDIF